MTSAVRDQKVVIKRMKSCARQALLEGLKCFEAKKKHFVIKLYVNSTQSDMIFLPQLCPTNVPIAIAKTIVKLLEI